MEGLPLNLKDVFHIFGCGNVFKTPIKVGFFFDFFDGEGTFKDVGFFQVNRADGDFESFEVIENFILLPVQYQ